MIANLASSDCIQWLGAKNTKGYGICRVGQKTVRVHRFVAAMVYGPIPTDMVVRHLCNNPSCVRIEHLRPGTHKQNVRDMILAERDRMLGERNPSAKLSETQVRAIKYSRVSGQQLAKEYGVSRTCISEIKTGRKWRHVV